MKVPLSWLNKYVKIDDLDQEKFLDQFAKQICDIEEIIEFGSDLEDIIIGQIKEVKKHPNSEKLHICQVDVGKKKPIQLVAGAGNMQKDDYVPVIPDGGVLPGGYEISSRKLAGKLSQGMMCSQKELGIGDDHTGILVLNEYLGDEKVTLKPGASFVKTLDLKDTVLDLDGKIITNRPYAFGIQGIAREVSALLDRDFNEDAFDNLEIHDGKTEEITIEIEDKKACGRLSGAVFKNLKIKESPLWLKKALLSVGMRPINNIVDTTNYLMYDLGHPMHAFDYDKITPNSSGEKVLGVRFAKKGEKLTTLDNEKRDLEADKDFVNIDATGPIGLAGVMGGLSTEVDAKTKSILLVVERFDPVMIRKTAHRHNLPSEASLRFEKGLDPNNTVKSIQKTASLLQELAEADYSGEIADNYPDKLEPWTVKLDLTKVEKLIGIDIDPKFISKLFDRLLIKAVGKTPKEWTLEIPTYRTDVKLDVDLIEDIGRFYGYDNIEATTPKGTITPPKADPMRAFEKKARNLMAQLGYTETKNPTFISAEIATQLGMGDLDAKLKLVNPASKEYAYLRPNILPSLILVTKENLKNYETFRIFEQDKIYAPGKGKGSAKDKYESARPVETKVIGGMFATNKKQKSQSEQILQIKGEVEQLLKSLGIDKTQSVVSKEKLFEINYAIEFKSGKLSLASFGVFPESNLKEAGIKTGIVVGFQLNIENCYKAAQKDSEFENFSVYPPVKQDFTFDLDKKTRVGDAMEIINAFTSDIMGNIEFLSTYKNSFSIRVNWQSMDVTLVEKDVSEERKRFLKYVEGKGLKIRAQ